MSQWKEQIIRGADDIEETDFQADARGRARKRLETVDIPGAKDEEWRFVRLDPLTGTDFAPADTVDAEVTDEMVAPYTFDESDGLRLVFVNGRFSDELSSLDGFPEGVYAGHLNMSEDDEAAEAVSEYLGSAAEPLYDEKGDFFSNLNAAGYSDGAYVVVPKDTAVDGVVHILHVATESGEPYVAHPRNLVAVGGGSKVSVVEEYVGPSTGVYFNNALTEISVAESAKVNHVKIQDESTDAYHIGRTAIDMDEWGTYDSKTISLGAKFSRFDVWASGDGTEIDCTLDGLAVLEDEQVSDTHTTMDHRQSNAGSHQLHKMILDDKAHAVFNGKIFVQKDAQKIDAYQLNRTLLLSEKAKVNTKPQLEIFADDVSCTHGATIGQLEDEHLFYLQSRGLDYDEARELLIYAFAAEIVDTLPVDAVKERLAETISRRTRKEE